MNPHNGMFHAKPQDHHTTGVGHRTLTAESNTRSLQRAFRSPRRFVRKAGQALGTLTLALVLAACGIAGPVPVTPAAQSGATQVSTVPLTFNGQTSGDIVATALAANKKSHAQANDVEYDAANVVRLTLTGSGASVTGSGVEVDGSIVTISAPGTYLISGTLADGRVVVNSADDGKVRLVLDGASITSSNGPAIHIAVADEAVVVLAEGSSNVLKDGKYTTVDSDAPNAALYSMADLTIGGTGALSVEGTSFDGIASKDGLVILGGRITVSAADDGIRGKDYLIVEGGSLTVKSSGDGLKSDNEDEADRGYVAILSGDVTVNASGDAIYGFTDVIVRDGTIVATTSGTATANAPSSKGLKAGTSVVIGGGTITVDVVDDAIHSDGDVFIANGSLILSTADDAVHAEKALTVSGGTLTIKKSYEGLEASQITLTGGSISVNSSDDAVNAASGSGTATTGGRPATAATGSNTLTISGGVIVVNSNGDGLDANGSFAMTGGTVIVSGPTAQGNGALDVDGSFTVSGGTLLAAGSSGMAIAPATNSAQGWVSVTFNPVVSAGSVIQLVKGDTVIATYTLAKDASSVIFSSSAITSGDTYDVYVGGKASGDAVAGYSAGGSLSGASKIQNVTAGQHTAAGRGGFRR